LQAASSSRSRAAFAECAWASTARYWSINVAPNCVKSGTATVGSTRLGGDDGRLFARPWPVVKLFREFMERNLRPDPVPDAIWNLPATQA
jgi:hypothetical protein